MTKTLQQQIACFNRRIPKDTFVKDIRTNNLYQIITPAYYSDIFDCIMVITVNCLEGKEQELPIKYLETYEG